MIRSGSVSDYQYPRWYVLARDSFESDYQEHLRRLDAPAELKTVVGDATNPGRRIRPTLYYALWNCRLLTYPDESECLPAIAVELFHTASIIVDDIADKEVMRRNKVPLYRKYDIDTAVLTSHYLVAKGYEKLFRHRRGEHLAAAWTRCYRSSTVGQFFDIKQSAALSQRELQARSLEKTIPFFSFIAQSQTAISGAERPDFVMALEVLGTCFQISNDVVDMVYFESTSRHQKDVGYRLSPSYLIPLLIEAGSIREEEVYSTLPYERHLEISRAAQNLVGGVTSFLRNLFVPAVETIKQADVLPCERDLATDFVRELTLPNFWLHHHV